MLIFDCTITHYIYLRLEEKCFSSSDLYTDNSQCCRCRRRLPIHLFQGDLCRACRNIDPSHIGRYALGAYVEKHVFLGDNGDVSVDDFVRRHADAVESTFNEAKNKHMYVLSVFKVVSHVTIKVLRNFYFVAPDRLVTLINLLF